MNTTTIVTFLKQLDGRTITREVDEELRFHIEMLEREHVHRGMSAAEAKATAIKRFGDFDGIKGQCVEIARRSRPVRRALKAFLILLGITGLVVHIVSADYKVARIGDTLIMIAVSARLLLYVRGLSPSTFFTRSKGASLSVTADGSKTSSR